MASNGDRSPVGAPPVDNSATGDLRPTPLPTDTGSPTELSSPNASSTSNTSGLSKGATIGLGVGIPIVLIVIGVVIFFIYRRRGKPKKDDIDPSKEELGKQSGGNLISPSPTYPTTDTASGYGYEGVTAAPSAAPQARPSKDGEEENRPVSRAVSPMGEPVGEGRATADEDNEMQWILEEERKVRERKEQQQRLPTKGSQTSWDGMTGSGN